MDKFQKLYEEIVDIIHWAVYQEHISEDAGDILLQNIERDKEEIENQ